MADEKTQNARRRRANGDGSVYRRKDGYWVGAYYTYTVSGIRKRAVVYGRTRGEAEANLVKAQEKARQGIPIPDKSWKLGAYLDYWLEHVVKTSRRPATYALYETNTRLYIKPALGNRQLTRLSVAAVQVFLNQRLEQGDSIRQVHILRTVLSSALSRAVREELVSRNVARLVELPQWHRKEVRPWSADEARRFLEVARPDPLYPAFVLLVLYGLRRGEVLGLRWEDVDFDTGEIRIRQQVQRVRGVLHVGPVKTAAGRRELPLLELAREVLKVRQECQAADRKALGAAWQDTGLVFTTRTGRPVEPRNLTRSFRRLCDAHGLRRVNLHHLRHTVASLLKKLGVPPRDAMMILGHSRISVTQEIYTHVDAEARSEAMGRIHELFRDVRE